MLHCLAVFEVRTGFSKTHLSLFKAPWKDKIYRLFIFNFTLIIFTNIVKMKKKNNNFLTACIRPSNKLVAYTDRKRSHMCQNLIRFFFKFFWMSWKSSSIHDLHEWMRNMSLSEWGTMLRSEVVWDVTGHTTVVASEFLNWHL